VEALGAIPARRLRALAKELGELARRLGPTDPGLFFEEEHPPPRRTR
jgi:hypothetical protein